MNLSSPLGFLKEKRIILIDIAFCVANEKAIKHFLRKIKYFTHNNFDFFKKRITKKVKLLFKIKDRNPRPLCCVYQGTCLCNSTYIGETKRNVEIRWFEHSKPSEKSEPAKHLKSNHDHGFKWKVIVNAPIDN